MSYKSRPALVPVLAGTSVNPANSGPQYPMSYPSAPNPSFERTGSRDPARQQQQQEDKSPAALSAASPTKPASADADSHARASSGSMYDPVRHDTADSRYTGSAGDGQRSADAVGDGANGSVAVGGDYMTPNRKRSREDASFAEDDADAAADSDASPAQGSTSKGGRGSKDSRKTHLCDHCGATFTRQHNLKSHLMTHTSSKKEFVCTECNTEFRRLHDLKRHEKLHTGEKPFACEVCGRRFARADALARHTKAASDGGCVNSKKGNTDYHGNNSNNNTNDNSMVDTPVRRGKAVVHDPIETSSKAAVADPEPALDPLLGREDAAAAESALANAAAAPQLPQIDTDVGNHTPGLTPAVNSTAASSAVSNLPFVPSPSGIPASGKPSTRGANGKAAGATSGGSTMAQHPMMLVDDIHERFNDLKSKHDQLQLSHERMTQRLKQLESGEEESDGAVEQGVIEEEAAAAAASAAPQQ